MLYYVNWKYLTNSLLIMSMKALQESTDSVDREACSVTPLVTEKLWVEKYAPNSFTELLSDEHTNREVNTIPNCTLLLQRSQPFCWCLISFTWHVCMCLVQVLLWLKQWDSCVFGSHIRATCDDVLSALRRHSSTIQKNANNKNFFSKTKGGPVDMPLNAPSSNPEGLGGSFSKRSPVDSTPEQKVGVSTTVLWPKAFYKRFCWFVMLVPYCNWIPSWCCRCCYSVVHLVLEKQHLLMLQPDIVATMLLRSVLWSYNTSCGFVV